MIVPASQAPVRTDSARAFGVTAVLLVVVAAALTLARYNSIPKPAGLALFQLGALLALGVIALGCAASWRGRRLPLRQRLPIFVAVATALGYAGLAGGTIFAAMSTPALFDVTTNLARPPEFLVLPPRATELHGSGAQREQRALHARAYKDLQTLRVARPVGEVAQAALDQAKLAGWTIVASDLAQGRIEATATVSYLRWHDDIVIQISPGPDGLGALVDMRSVSREGNHDLGRNAERIRAFLEKLAAAS